MLVRASETFWWLKPMWILIMVSAGLVCSLDEVTALVDLEDALTTRGQARWQFPTEHEGECQSPIHERGVCMSVRRCPGLLKIRDVSTLRRFVCGFEGKTPLLCCPHSYRRPIAVYPPESDPAPDPSLPVIPVKPEFVIYPNDQLGGDFSGTSPHIPTSSFPQNAIIPERPRHPLPQSSNKPRPYPPQEQHLPPLRPHPPTSRPRPPSTRPHPPRTTTQAPPPTTPTPAPLRPVNLSQRPPKPGFLPETCGFSNVSVSRIVGGNEAQPGAWPWMAAIYIQNKRFFTHVCGGALISNKHVVTAAHCVKAGNRQQTLPPGIFVVRLGDHNIQTTDDLPLGVTLDVAVAGIRRHAAFNPRSYLNDIALMLLAAEVPFSQYIQPVCLPYAAVPNNLVDQFAFVTGWGYMKYEGTKSDVLQQAQIRVWKQEDCAAAFHREVDITQEYICAGDGAGLQDSCQGDSGGPLVFYEDGRFYLIGIVSFGKRCATPGYPGVYTRVTEYLGWLNDNF